MKPRILVLEVRDKEGLDTRPIAWMLVEREENYTRYPDKNLIGQATICLSYQLIHPKFSLREKGKGSFEGSYSSASNAVSLTSHSMSEGAVFLNLPELEGQRIGTYLMNEIIQWAKQWPDAKVNRIKLISVQAAQEDNKRRRNRFYEQFGLVFDYSDDAQKEGYSRPIPVHELRTIETWKENIAEHNVLDYIEGLLYDGTQARSELAVMKHSHQELNKKYWGAVDQPVMWALLQVVGRYKEVVLLLLVFVAAVLVAWKLVLKL